MLSARLRTASRFLWIYGVHSAVRLLGMDLERRWYLCTCMGCNVRRNRRSAEMPRMKKSFKMNENIV